MKISKFGHACLLVEEGQARILFDPGAFSSGFEALTGLSAIMITHQHQDHLVAENLQKLLAANPDAKFYADEGSVQVLAQEGGPVAQAVHSGEELTVAGVRIEVLGTEHAVVHPAIPTIPNVGYLISGKLFVPGDAFTRLQQPVEVLALPLGAPWNKLSEVADYALAVKPAVAIPVHDAVLAMPDMYAQILERLVGSASIEVRVVPNSGSTNV